MKAERQKRHLKVSTDSAGTHSDTWKLDTGQGRGTQEIGLEEEGAGQICPNWTNLLFHHKSYLVGLYYIEQEGTQIKAQRTHLLSHLEG